MKTRTTQCLRPLLWLFCLTWLAVLVWLSSQDGAATAETSIRIAKFLMRLWQIPAARLADVDSLLRTLAHFAGFLVLGCAAFVTVRLTWPKQRHSALWVIALCSPIAVLDEVKKIFIPGRHLSWAEAGLNILGVAVGVTIPLVCGAIRNRHIRHTISKP